MVMPRVNKRRNSRKTTTTGGCAGHDKNQEDQGASREASPGDGITGHGAVTQANSMDMPQIKIVFHNQVIAGRSNSLPCCHHCKQFILHCQQDKM